HDGACSCCPSPCSLARQHENCRSLAGPAVELAVTQQPTSVQGGRLPPIFRTFAAGLLRMVKARPYVVPGQKLHQFDLQLCDYVLGNIRQHLDKGPFEGFVREQISSPQLRSYLLTESESEQEPLLLSDAELLSLMTALEGPLNLDRKWRPYPQLHRRYVHIVK